MLKSITSVLVPVHPEGYRFIGIFAAVSVVLFLLDVEALGWIGLILTAWCAYFFRDPERVTPLRSGLVVSPADGRISAVEDVVPPVELGFGEGVRERISIFMNVFDVHVNRSPVEGRILRIAYVPGKFVSADLDKASTDNERQVFVIEVPEGANIGVVQIAGLVARRIVKFVSEGADVQAGERIGLIRFGSRVDVYLPEGKRGSVAVGQRAIAGETVLADLLAGDNKRPFRRS